MHFQYRAFCCSQWSLLMWLSSFSSCSCWQYIVNWSLLALLHAWAGMKTKTSTAWKCTCHTLHRSWRGMLFCSFHQVFFSSVSVNICVHDGWVSVMTVDFCHTSRRMEFTYNLLCNLAIYFLAEVSILTELLASLFLLCFSQQARSIYHCTNPSRQLRRSSWKEVWCNLGSLPEWSSKFLRHLFWFLSLGWELHVFVDMFVD